MLCLRKRSKLREWTGRLKKFRFREYFIVALIVVRPSLINHGGVQHAADRFRIKRPQHPCTLHKSGDSPDLWNYTILLGIFFRQKSDFEYATKYVNFSIIRCRMDLEICKTHRRCIMWWGRRGSDPEDTAEWSSMLAGGAPTLNTSPRCIQNDVIIRQ